MKNKLINLALSEGLNIQIYEVDNDGIEIEIFNKQIKKYEVEKASKYTIKAIKGNKSVTIYTANLKNPSNIISNIKSILETTDNEDKDILAINSKINKRRVKKLDIDYNEIINRLKKIYDIKEKYGSLKSITTSFSHNKSTIKLTNKDVDINYKNDIAYFTFEVNVNYNDQDDSGFGIIPYSEYNLLESKIISKIKEVEDKLKMNSLNSGIYNIILSNECVSNLLNSTFDMFDAFNIDKKTSILTDKLNEKVFNNKVTIIEDPCKDYGYGMRIFDSEGSACYKKIIIDHGIFKNEISDNKSSIKNGNISTGNSSGVKNMYMCPGRKGLKELFSKLNDGIYIDYITGLHSGLNKITGHISLQAQGYIVKNGKKTLAVKNIVLVSDIFELFNNIMLVGNDLKFDYYTAAPSLLIKNINITGNN